MPINPKILIAITFTFPLRNPIPMRNATGIVVAIVKTPHGLLASACTTTSASTRHENDLIVGTLMARATSPGAVSLP